MITEFKVRKKGTKHFIDLLAKDKNQAIINVERIKHSKNFMVKDPRIEPSSLKKARRITKLRSQ